MGASRLQSTLAEKVCTERPKGKQTCRSEMQVDGPAHEATASIRGMRTLLGQRRKGESALQSKQRLEQTEPKGQQGRGKLCDEDPTDAPPKQRTNLPAQINVRKRTQATEPEKQKEGTHPAVLNVARTTTHLPCLNALTPSCGLSRFETKLRRK